MKKPFESSYWVVPAKLLVGEIPTASSKRKTLQKLKGLVKAGVGAVLNLMEEYERDYSENLFYDYSGLLKENGITIYRYPIRDMDVPSPIQMMRIIKQIEFCNKHGKIAYLHCWGGLGRTGTVVGCYLLANKIANTGNVLERIIELKKGTPLASEDSPQNNEQRQFILDWMSF